MTAVQQMTLPYALGVFGCIAVALVLLALCLVAWLLVNRIVSPVIEPPVKVGKLPDASARWRKSPRTWPEILEMWEKESRR